MIVMQEFTIVFNLQRYFVQLYNLLFKSIHLKQNKTNIT